MTPKPAMLTTVGVCLVVACALSLVLSASTTHAQQQPPKFVAGYILMSATRNGELIGLKELSALAQSAATLPVTRVVIGFFNPTLTYVQGSNTLRGVGLNASTTGDYGFASLQQSIATLQEGGVEVFLSMGGWNYNCFPYTYMRYSVGGYGTHTPNYWKINKYGNGDLKNCNETNQYCWVCEPPSEGTSLSDFAIFPEVPYSDAWQQAMQFVESGAKGNQTPQWHADMAPGTKWTDPKTGITVTVPGQSSFLQQHRDPYGDFVDLASDLGVDGIDLDYEEFWHADYFKFGQGPWWLPQTVYKYAAIAKTLMIHIQAKNPAMKLSTAASAVGGWGTSWWGGNLKGTWYFTNLWYPSVIEFMSKGQNAGGINVMTYDLSDNPEFHECPEAGICTLPQQVDFYMKTYKQAGIPANVGYEVGTPAYPSPTEDPTHQLPLTPTVLQSIISKTQPGLDGGFFWEMFKPSNSSQSSPTDVAQAICKTLLPSSSRCSGTIPNVN